MIPLRAGLSSNLMQYLISQIESTVVAAEEPVLSVFVLGFLCFPEDPGTS